MADFGTGASLTTSRRALVRGAAWTVPVVAVAATAPAYAASCDSTAPTTMNLISRTGGDGTTVSFASTVSGLTVGSYNFSTNDPVMTQGWLEFENNPRGDGSVSNPSVYQDITVTFSRAVRNLTMDIADLDTSGSGTGNSRTYNYWDAIAVHGTTVSYEASTMGSSLTGSGSLADPWRQQTFANTPPASNTAASNKLTFAFSGPVTTFKFRYWCIRGRSNYNGTQAVWIGNMSYKVNCD